MTIDKDRLIVSSTYGKASAEQTSEPAFRQTQIEDLKNQVRRQANTIRSLMDENERITQEFARLHEQNEETKAQYDALVAATHGSRSVVTELSLMAGRMTIENRDLKDEYEALRECHQALNAQVVADLDAEAVANAELRRSSEDNT